MAGGVAVMGWWKTAKPGDKVMCVDGDFPNSGGPLPIKGEVYTISEIVFWDHWPAVPYSGPAVFLTEIARRRCVTDNRIHPFGVRRFRPVQTKSTETGMAILKSILNGAPVKDDA
jgi:hypothetical protein